MTEIDGGFSDPIPVVPHATVPRPSAVLPVRAFRRVVGGSESPGYRTARKAKEAVFNGRVRADSLLGSLRGTPRVGSGQVPVRIRGHPAIATIDPSATPASVHRRTVRVVSDALKEAGVPFFAVPDTHGRVRFGIPRSDAGRTRQILAALGSRASVGRVWRDRTLSWGPAPLAREADFTAARAVRVVLAHATSDGAHVIGQDAALQLDFWRQLPDGVLGAPVRNRFTTYLTPAAREPARLAFEDLDLPTFRPLARRHVDDISFPIDAVVTWVDGSDAEWRARKAARQRQLDTPHRDDAVSDSRFVNFDELRYVLRSLAMYAPWLRRIWIVSDDQHPQWLDSNRDDIRVVSHREIWRDPTVLPVFNSHAIEAHLHHIPGLAEHYLYFNDDVFLGRAVEPNLFFTGSGLSRCYPWPGQIGLGPPSLREPPPLAAAKNARSLLLAGRGVIQTQQLCHAPFALRRSVAERTEEGFPEEYRATGAAAFRSPRDFAPIVLQTWYAVAGGQCVAGPLEYRYLDVSRREGLAGLAWLRRTRDVDTFCLNSGDSGEVPRERIGARLARDLAAYYPFRAAWEID